MSGLKDYLREQKEAERKEREQAKNAAEYDFKKAMDSIDYNTRSLLNNFIKAEKDGKTYYKSFFYSGKYSRKAIRKMKNEAKKLKIKFELFYSPSHDHGSYDILLYRK